MAYNPWDDEDDEDEEDDDNDDPFGEDGEDPYGEDEPPQGAEEEDEEAEADLEGDEEEEKKKKKKDDDDDKGGDIAAKVSGGKKKPDRKKMDAQAKALNLLPLPGPVAKIITCPACKQDSLYLDTLMSTGIRITVAIVKGVIGCDNMDKDLNVVRFCCLNKKCKEFYKRTGTKFKFNSNGSPMPLMTEKHYFHADI